jgi:hypothetical protein
VFFMLAVFTPSLGVFALSWIFGFRDLHLWLHPGAQFNRINSTADGLIIVPGLLAAIPVSFIWTNIVCWLVPPVRRANDKAFHRVPGGSFRETTGGLAKSVAVLLPICATLTLIGVFAPWLN